MDVLYYIVFTPKYRRKEIYYKIRADLINIIRHLYKHRGVEIIEGHMMPRQTHEESNVFRKLIFLKYCRFPIQIMLKFRYEIRKRCFCKTTAY